LAGKLEGRQLLNSARGALIPCRRRSAGQHLPMRHCIEPMSIHDCAHGFAAAVVGLSCGAAPAADALVVANYNVADYGAWKTTGEAVGTAQ